MFDHHKRKIEKPDFQIQFVALSGFSVLELVLEQHDYVRSLIAALSSGEVLIEAVYQRILCLLPRVEQEVNLSYDGSIVVYLYCLSKFDLTMSYKASIRIQKTAGLFWSRRMARAVVEMYREKQMRDSVVLSSDFDHQSVRFDNVKQVMWFGSDVSKSQYRTDTTRRFLQWSAESITFAQAAV